MSVHVFCADPAGLLGEIKKAINSRSIVTWQLDSDGDLSHSPPQWLNLAWMRPRTRPDRLTFSILGRKGSRMSRETYGVYHGRLIEMLLMHFDLKFSRACASALGDETDVIVEP